MGFFAKLFRRKHGAGAHHHHHQSVDEPPSRRSGGRKSPKAAETSTSRTDNDSPTADLVEEQAAAARSSRVRGPDLTSGAQRPAGQPQPQQQRIVVSPRTTPTGIELASSRSSGPVDLDASDFDNETDVDTSPKSSPRLSVQQLQQFDQQQQPQQQPQFTMATTESPRFSAGQVQVPDDNYSDAESSSFNISTDAEDTEYENLKRGVISPVANYNTDGETSVFPNLQTDDEGTQAESGKEDAARMQIVTVAANNTNKKPEESTTTTSTTTSNAAGWKKEDRSASPAWKKEDSGSSPTTWKKEAPWKTDDNAAFNKDDSAAWSPKKNASQFSSFATANVGFEGQTPSFPSTFNNNNNSSTATGGGPRRQFISPKSKSTDTTTDFSKNAFADFADFSKADFDTQGWNDPQPEQRQSRGKVFIEADKSAPLVERSASNRQLNSSSGSLAAHHTATDTSLTELLAQAKSKSSRGRKSSNSVNSAPVMTAAYLREHHGLRSRTGRYSGESRSSAANESGASVSDIIKNLEAANATRVQGPHRRSGSDAHSAQTGDANGSVRSAKERLREKRRHRRRSGGGNDEDSSESDENEWLFDEVTGALGPRGIAADLESLTGRSDRSRSSGGGRSHKSHRSHRSHKSHRSSRRRHKTSSGESVDSHGSKKSHGSRRSRSSRYSHRSTRSYLSQMSEQSRSVANDLLRLEMQLAMVGSTGENGSASVASGRSRKHGSTSSAARRAVASSARRSRVTVLAPPGKLGIILANKADSKGTVVSGVRTSSVLAEKISPGDRIVAIDGEDVSLMTVSEITTIMARKSDFERTLTVLTTPKHMEQQISPRSSDFRYRN